MSDTYKIDITIGNARFSAEGPRDAVESAFKAWRDLLAQPIAAAPIPAAAQSPSPQPEAPAGAPSDALLARVFSMDGPTGVSLRILPRTDKAAADALILLLYGFLKLRSEGAVTALRLNQGANRSGLRLPRVDRVIAARGGLITQAGSRRGKRYGLNNPGVAHAERLLGEILNQMGNVFAAAVPGLLDPEIMPFGMTLIALGEVMRLNTQPSTHNEFTGVGGQNI